MANAKKKTEFSGEQPEGPAPKKGPAETIRIEDCNASIWRRTRDDGSCWYSVTFERSYVDKNGTRKYTGFFSPESLGKLISLCQKVDEKIRTLQKADEQHDAA